MFTGITEKLVEVIDNQIKDDANQLVLLADYEQLNLGESIAVNGVCLTLLAEKEYKLSFDLSSETLSKTNLSLLKPGDKVNIERAMQASSRFGGHYVSGHIDKTAKVLQTKIQGEFLQLTIGEFAREDMKFLLPKGSITVNGVSLTINNVGESSIELMLIPHTLAMTNLDALQPGDSVNIEFDYLTRIVAHQLHLAGQLTNEVNL